MPTHPPMVDGPCPTFASGTVTVSAGGATIASQMWMGTGAGGALILYWHATGSNATNEVPIALDTGAVTAAGGMIVGFEASTRTGTPTGNTGDDVWYQSDAAFADQVTACAVQQQRVDPRRVHTAGYSAGGLQAVYMWFARSGYIASVISYSGGDGAINKAAVQEPAHPPAAIAAHGAMGSDVVGIDFAQTSATWEQSDIKPLGGFSIDCGDGQGHVYLARLSNLSPVALRFFEDHPYGVEPEPYASLPAGFPSYCKID
jgi:hypothetical protein